MTKIKPINLSPSFLGKVLSQGYDYAVAEKLGLIEKDTKAMADGRLMHEMIAHLLGDKPANYAISPFDSFRTKEAREWRDSQPDNLAIISQERADELEAIAKRVVNHPRIKALLDAGKVQTEQVVEKKVGEYNVKGIIDATVVGKAKSVIDWKFVSTQVFDSFSKKALYQNYDLQASVYDFLVEPANIYFAIIENQAPHRIRLFHCDESFLISGGNKFDKAMKTIKAENWREPTFDIDDVGELMSWENYNG